MTAGDGKPTLTDSAEEALRSWLVSGRRREGERLPPEHELASMLGISRGTLRVALERLEATGEISRRQGSGTFVGPGAGSPAFQEGLERLESYSALARKRGLQLGVRDLRIELTTLEPELARLLGAEAGAPAMTVSRVLLAEGAAAALMVDTVHPGMTLPGEARLRQALESGDMVLDVLEAQGVQVAFANTRIVARLLSGRDRAARALGVERTTAVLELEESFHLASGEVTHHSRDLFVPSALDLRVVRYTAAGPLSQVREDPAGRPPSRRSAR